MTTSNDLSTGVNSAGFWNVHVAAPLLTPRWATKVTWDVVHPHLFVTKCVAQLLGNLDGAQRLAVTVAKPDLAILIWPYLAKPHLARTGRIWPTLFDRIWPDRILQIVVFWWGGGVFVVGVLWGCCWATLGRWA